MAAEKPPEMTSDKSRWEWRCFDGGEHAGDPWRFLRDGLEVEVSMSREGREKVRPGTVGDVSQAVLEEDPPLQHQDKQNNVKVAKSEKKKNTQ